MTDAANSRQVGGKHYKTTYEHWDLCVDVPLGYLEGNATKYVARWRSKGGVQDLEKAMHYLDKLYEVESARSAPRWPAAEFEACFNRSQRLTERFCQANNLTPLEAAIVITVASWRWLTDLELARKMLLTLIRIQPAPLTEENKHAPRVKVDLKGRDVFTRQQVTDLVEQVMQEFGYHGA